MFELGLQDDQLPVGDARRVRWGLDRLERATRLARLDLIWKFVEPTRGEYRLAAYDRMLEGLANRNIRTIIDIHTPPEWATDADGIDIAAYRALVERFLCRPASSRTVVALEPWNEPNIAFFLKPQWERTASGWQPRSPRIYAALVRAAAAARERCRPALPLMGPALAATGSAPGRGGVGVLDFWRELPAGLPLDVISQHLYLAKSPEDSQAMPSYRRMDELLEVADRSLGGTRPVVISETGFLTGETPYHSTVVTPEEQVERLEASVSLARENPRIRALIYFNLEDNPNWPAGLWRLRGAAKPAWSAFLTLQRANAGNSGESS